MIVHIAGKLRHKAPTHVVVDVGGLGYEVRISLYTFSAVKALEACELFVYQYIKGDVQTLYGFASVEEKQWFVHLINVNSVGPRTALTVLSSLSPPELEQAIANGQVSTLKTIKGVGDKAAQRIVLELQGKLAQKTGLGAKPLAMSTTTAVEREALAALIKLGIGQAAAAKALAKVSKRQPDAVSVETLIKQALQVS
ncbi:MAG: Holliday junction branch migration protein RuvA [Bacteroidota bacterium]